MNHFHEKEELLRVRFSSCTSDEERYQILIQMGKSLPKMKPSLLTEENRVIGCQSQTHVYTKLKDGKLYIQFNSDAFISSGLASILVELYSGEAPEAIIKHRPNILDDLGISTTLSPNRANGLHSMLLRVKNEAVKAYKDRR